jgi:hypothetical protein
MIREKANTLIASHAPPPTANGVPIPWNLKINELSSGGEVITDLLATNEDVFRPSCSDGGITKHEEEANAARP